jgi:hypothetical protein
VRDRKNAKARPIGRLFKTSFMSSRTALSGYNLDTTALVMTNPKIPWALPWSPKVTRRRRLRQTGAVKDATRSFGQLCDPIDTTIASLLRIKAVWDVQDAPIFVMLSSAAARFSYHSAHGGGVNFVSSLLNDPLLPSRQLRFQSSRRCLVSNTVSDVSRYFLQIPSTAVVGLGPASVLSLARVLATFELRQPALEVTTSIAFTEHFFSYSPPEVLEGCRCIVRTAQVCLQHDIHADISSFFSSNVPLLPPKVWGAVPRLWRFFTSRGLLLDAIEVLYLARRMAGGAPHTMLPRNPVSQALPSLKFCFLAYVLQLNSRDARSALGSLPAHEAEAYVNVLAAMLDEALRDMVRPCTLPNPAMTQRIKKGREMMAGLLGHSER